jgi:2-polyprenyl-6-hydroxyphenyl methylase / 3-demethylubiquinone-9 3-methyltransferase
MRNVFRAQSRTAAIDPASAGIDNDYYGHIGDAWWDPRGPVGGLHEMNPVRADYVDRSMRAALGRPDPADVRVLDVGCGGGLLTEAIARLGYRVAGVDQSLGAVLAARRHARSAGVAVDYQAGSAYALGVADASFDAVVTSDVFEHLHDLPAAVAEIARALRPGGVLVFDTINRTVRSYLLMILLAQQVFRIVHPRTHRWRMFIRPEELRAVLAANGLDLRDLVGLVPAKPVPAAALEVLRRRSIGGFAIGPDLSASYLGYAVKSSQG